MVMNVFTMLDLHNKLLKYLAFGLKELTDIWITMYLEFIIQMCMLFVCKNTLTILA
jgi:hypothetical protein